MPQKFHKITLKLQVKEKNGRKVKCLYFSAWICNIHMFTEINFDTIRLMKQNWYIFFFTRLSTKYMEVVIQQSDYPTFAYLTFHFIWCAVLDNRKLTEWVTVRDWILLRLQVIMLEQQREVTTVNILLFRHCHYLVTKKMKEAQKQIPIINFLKK
jgi:hypothetical protein